MTHNQLLTNERLVYLDSAQFSWLERTPEKKTDDFIRRWQDTGATLALSFHHVQEVAQLGDENSVVRRLEAIARFESVRFSFQGSISSTQMEARAELLRLSGANEDAGSEVTSALFPTASASEFARTVWEARDAFGETRRITELAADQENLWRKFHSEVLGGRSVKKNKNLPVDAKKVRDLVPGFEGIEQLMKRFTGGGNEESAETTREHLESVYGLSNIGAIGRAPDADLPGLAVFFTLAREEAIRLALAVGLERAALLPLVLKLNPYQCPGLALQLALHRERQKAGGPTEPGHLVDEWHLAYAPYVDLAFVDKETLDLVQRAHGNASELLPDGVVMRLRTPGNLDQVIAAVEQSQGPT